MTKRWDIPKSGTAPVGPRRGRLRLASGEPAPREPQVPSALPVRDVSALGSPSTVSGTPIAAVPESASSRLESSRPESSRLESSRLESSRPAPAGLRAEAARSRLARLECEGAESLSTAELLAVLAGDPRAEGDVERLVSVVDLASLSRRDVRHLAREFDLSRRAAARWCAAFALGRRVERCVRPPRTPLRAPSLVHELMAGELRGLDRETFHALLLDGKHRLQSRRRISEGTLTTSLVHPREVFAPAVREGAAALIVVHNHPSGDPDPSPEDLAVTRRLIDAGVLMGVPLLDHVVIAGDRFVSLRERMRFDGG